VAKVFLLSAVLVIGIVTVLAFTVDSGGHKGDLIVQRAGSGSISSDGQGGFSLVMNDTSDLVWFSDRPDRKAGTLKADDFLALWQTDEFSHDPPNAALEVDGFAYPVELVSVKHDEPSSTFTYKVAELHEPPSLSVLEAGTLREMDFGAATLFIDSSPTSVNPQVTD
jgi:hypothetical protein